MINFASLPEFLRGHDNLQKMTDEDVKKREEKIQQKKTKKVTRRALGVLLTC